MISDCAGERDHLCSGMLCQGRLENRRETAVLAVLAAGLRFDCARAVPSCNNLTPSWLPHEQRNVAPFGMPPSLFHPLWALSCCEHPDTTQVEDADPHGCVAGGPPEPHLLHGQVLKHLAPSADFQAEACAEESAKHMVNAGPTQCVAGGPTEPHLPDAQACGALRPGLS